VVIKEGEEQRCCAEFGWRRNCTVGGKWTHFEKQN